MKRNKSKLRLFLCTFSGEDDFIIRNCSLKIQLYFSFIGLFVIAIFVGCFVSSIELIAEIFQPIGIISNLASIFIGIFWALIVTTIYLLLLYTISPVILPTSHSKSKNKIKKQSSFTLSLILRIVFILIFALIMAQPLNITAFTIFHDQEFSKKLLVEKYNHMLSGQANVLIWLFLTSIGCFVFLLPIYFKFLIRNNTDFYNKKEELEKRFVMDNYREFKNKYPEIFKHKFDKMNVTTWQKFEPLLEKLKRINIEKYNLIYNEIQTEIKNDKIEKFEYWEDMPFRTIRKKDNRNIISEEDLLIELYGKNI